MATSVAELVFGYGVPFDLANAYMAGNPNATLDQALSAYRAYQAATSTTTTPPPPVVTSAPPLDRFLQARQIRGHHPPSSAHHSAFLAPQTP